MLACVQATKILEDLEPGHGHGLASKAEGLRRAIDGEKMKRVKAQVLDLIEDARRELGCVCLLTPHMCSCARVCALAFSAPPCDYGENALNRPSPFPLSLWRARVRAPSPPPSNDGESGTRLHGGGKEGVGRMQIVKARDRIQESRQQIGTRPLLSTCATRRSRLLVLSNASPPEGGLDLVL